MIDRVGGFVWYELLTTDRRSAAAFYAEIVGWTTKDASTAELAYTLLNAGDAPVAGLMALPEEGVRMGATPRWLGYVAVDDVDAKAAHIRLLGGAILVSPTDSNIGRIAVVADPQGATFALVTGLTYGRSQPGGSDEPGRVGWHELLAADRSTIFAFYGELLGWQQASPENDPASVYELFSAAGRTVGGMLTKLPSVPHACWLHYFNVDDVGAAARRVHAGGGRILQGPIELPDDCWILRCVDPQGGLFALQGAWDQKSSAPEVSWSASWDGMTSKGRMVLRKPKR
ncbi:MULTISPECIES: VOC family protein [unclassified Bradyrhizobium]|uniref:VOC family protein n=1 Tax=unclassified Bradyrhizobium TaxID=2631580 RepID=UPI0020B319F2|nr:MULTISPECIES: VOC family protein [unclassified Bradyrhizobium]MCP3379820.1 VOC family protein [Bradyrhizobium sp. CCGUVB4N]MCP3440570.1 VOC family protein [Bradyrhizobium sp. CCGUVB14]